MDWLEWVYRGRRKPSGVSEFPARPRIAVVTDSAAALPDEWIGPSIRSVAMPVMIGDRIFHEGEPDLATSLAVALAEGRTVKTSRPSPGAFESVYRDLEDAGYTGIVSLHLSGSLSGTVDAARLAARTVAIPVDVLDSRTAGMALGYGAMAGAELADQDGDLASVSACAASAVSNTSVYFYVPALDTLRRGGRIGPATGWLGTLLAVKPILRITDGQVVLFEKIRTAPKALLRLMEIAREDAAKRQEKGHVRICLAVHHFGNEDQAGSTARSLQAALPESIVVQSRLPAVLAAHTGLGAVAVAVASQSPLLHNPD